MKTVDVICPQCGSTEVTLSLESIAKPLGSFSLAGARAKFVIADAPFLTCQRTNCGWKIIGRLESGHAVFDPPTSPEESSL